MADERNSADCRNWMSSGSKWPVRVDRLPECMRKRLVVSDRGMRFALRALPATHSQNSHPSARVLHWVKTSPSRLRSLARDGI